MSALEEETRNVSIINLIQIRPWIYDMKYALYNCKKTQQASFAQIACDLSRNLKNTKLKGISMISFY